MRGVWAQALKEWDQFRRDRLTLALSGLLPIVMLLLFGTALSLDPDDLRLVVEDQDLTPLSRAYLDSFLATNDFRLVSKNSRESLEEVLASGEARMALRIPPDFTRNALQGLPANVQALIDGVDANTANALRNAVRAIHESFLRRQNDGSPGQPAVQAEVRFWYNPGLSDRRFFGSGALGLVLLLFPALLGALAASREHEQGTVIQVYASALTPVQWILGKASLYILVGALELVVCFGFGLWLFGYSVPADPTPFLVGSALYLTAGVFYGMAVGNALGNQAAAIQAVQLGAFLVSMLLSGFLTPISNAPAELRWVSYLLPATYYIHIVRDSLLRLGGWATSGWAVAALAGLALVFFGANLARMRRMQFND